MSQICVRPAKWTVSVWLTPIIAALACGLTWSPPSARAEFNPNVQPVLDVRRAAGPIEIDGELGDRGWVGAARAANFTQTWPGDNVEPAIGHEAWLTYDADKLYFAMVIEDDPQTIRASLRDRDEIWRDDYVGLIFDTYGTGAWAYELFINPLGVQMDLRWTPNGEDMGFDVVFDAESKITEDGWQVEVAIPFKSLRFPDRAGHEWRATFWHNQPRESRNRYSWSASNRDDPCWPCNWGTIRGIESVDSGNALEILPSVTAFDVNGLADEEDPGSSFEDRDSNAEAGVGLRYAINSSYAAEATINPDFSQVESDAAQIDANTTFALFFPERRPFFQEGSDLYSSWIDVIYTRSINDPKWATKLTGRSKRSSMAYLSAQDERTPIILPFEERSEILATGRSWSNIVRVRRSLFEDSHVGALFTDRRLEGGGSGTTFGADSMFRFFENYRLESQFIFSHTEEPEDATLSAQVDSVQFGDDGFSSALDGENFWGHASYLSLERSARRWNFDFDYRRTSETFRADNGFVTQNDNQRATFWTNWNWQPNNRILDEFSPFLMLGRVWNIDGVRKDEWIRPELNFQLKGQTFVGAGWLTSNELFGGVELNGIQRWSVNAETRFSEWIDGGAFFEKGDFPSRRGDVVLGDGSNLSVWGNIKPLSRLAIEPEVNFAQLDDPTTGEEIFRGYIARTRLSFQFNRELFLRLVLQYNEFSGQRDIEPLVSYKINPFTVFFVGSTHRLQSFGPDAGIFETDLDQSERQYFVKFQYLFRS